MFSPAAPQAPLKSGRWCTALPTASMACDQTTNMFDGYLVALPTGQAHCPLPTAYQSTTVYHPSPSCTYTLHLTILSATACVAFISLPKSFPTDCILLNTTKFIFVKISSHTALNPLYHPLFYTIEKKKSLPSACHLLHNTHACIGWIPTHSYPGSY